MTMIEKIAKAIRLRDSTDEFALARVAIEVMRDLVKCDPNGNSEDDLIINRYIDAALKE